MPEDSKALTANQLVGYNLMRIRKALGLSQDEAAERLKPYLGTKWSKSVYSTTERSYRGNRIRQFTADDLLAMSLAFGVTVGYFLTPPRPEDRPGDAVVVSGDAKVPWPHLVIAANGYNLPPAVLMRLRELPKNEQPEWPSSDPFAEPYGVPPGGA